MAEPARRLTGGCQCGAVRYALSAMPSRVSVCHCRMCQKALGSPVGAFAGVKRADLAWTRGAPKLFASSNLTERGFCADCGTPLTYRFVEGERISVTICSLDEPDTVAPTRQYGVASKRTWFHGIEALPVVEAFFSPELQARIVFNQHPDRETER